ncbi:MAG: hypothetical protein QG622_625 [Actinomycetota bacterium]|nr:hypothetical protein [Actinomycetota bacterium]
MIIGPPFHGTLDELKAFLSEGVTDTGPTFDQSGPTQVWLHHPAAAYQVYMVIMEIPWGIYKWIQKPSDPKVA